MNRVLSILRVLLAAGALLATSCVSVREQRLREFDRAPLAGMVYDWEQKPCPGAQLVVDGADGPRTDLDGRFVVGSLPRGEHTVRVVKPGFEPLEASISFVDRGQVLYLRVASHAQLVRAAEDALERRKMGEADALLARAEAVDADDPVGLYLRAIYHLNAGSVESAVAVLERMLAATIEQPAVYLALADIHQHRRGDPAAAAVYLREYLARVNDPDARARLEDLEK
jgi:tetratricopeptide (TPR) repeat protein